MSNTIQLIGATGDITAFAGLILGLLGLIILVLTILMPVYVCMIYGQIKGAKDAENIRAQTLQRMMFALESINFKMDAVEEVHPPDNLVDDPSWSTLNDAL
tara:strand:- start:4108 stop:4410 length:303 start_codon:yes stop_codon:yes gene_type:complete